MGNVLKTLFMPVGLGGLGIDFTKKKKKAAVAAPVYNEEKEKIKVVNQEAEANKRRVLAETDTIKTSALGYNDTTETKKKTLLGG